MNKPLGKQLDFYPRQTTELAHIHRWTILHRHGLLCPLRCLERDNARRVQRDVSISAVHHQLVVAGFQIIEVDRFVGLRADRNLFGLAAQSPGDHLISASDTGHRRFQGCFAAKSGKAQRQAIALKTTAFTEFLPRAFPVVGWKEWLIGRLPTPLPTADTKRCLVIFPAFKLLAGVLYLLPLFIGRVLLVSGCGTGPR
ncbi:hypothetical protein [Pseudomonas sp. GL-B-16]|uniref:hypothetical protein n=1 Tax=Pseudomonas sp. GL-B-16 TaxID=2832373 RepID=UPI001CBD6CC1|nr:hypothetical protein [Pseudomonas sp. GL-B-16]